MSRSDTIRQPAYRAIVYGADGAVLTDFTENARSATGLPGHKVRVFYETVPLKQGESVVYQIRHPGKSKFLTWSTRKSS